MWLRYAEGRCCVFLAAVPFIKHPRSRMRMSRIVILPAPPPRHENNSSTGGGDNQDFNVFLPADDVVDDRTETSSNGNSIKGGGISAWDATKGGADVGGAAVQETRSALEGVTSSSNSLSASPRSVASSAFSPSTGRPAKSGDTGSPSAAARGGSSGAVGGGGGCGGVSMGLLKERPAVVEEVMDEGVMSAFNCLGSSAVFGLVGCVVAAVSREPFQDTDASPQVRMQGVVVDIAVAVVVVDVVALVGFVCEIVSPHRRIPDKTERWFPLFRRRFSFWRQRASSFPVVAVYRSKLQRRCVYQSCLPVG